MLSKRVENTVGKEEIARYEQFLLFPQCFQKACFPGASRGVIVWEWVKTHTINVEWNKTQNDTPFVAFYNMHAVMFVLPDEMADVWIAGLQWFILISRLHHTGVSQAN